jgi:acyl carrier protein
MTANEKTETEIDVENEAEKQMGIRQVVLRALSDIAPEVDVDALDSSLELRDQIDIDSVDFLNFVIRLHNQLGIEIPDADVPKLGTLNGCIDYVLSKGKKTI